MGCLCSTDPPEAFLAFARQYHRAATALIRLVKEAEVPLYFMFAHTVELALKAFIRTRALSVDMTHSLVDLHRDCRKLGLPEDYRLTNIVKLLQQETELHGFRYYIHKTSWRPSIYNLCEIVDLLVAFVVRAVAAQSMPDAGSGVVLKLTMSVEPIESNGAGSDR